MWSGASQRQPPLKIPCLVIIDMPGFRYLNPLLLSALGLFIFPLCADAGGIGTDIPWVWFSSDAPAHADELAVVLTQLVLSGDEVREMRRMRALPLAASTRVVPVVHVQLDGKIPPRFTRQQADAIQHAVMVAGQRSTSAWVQLDLEAPDSQHDWYRTLVRQLREALPVSLKLSVTVLASECTRDDWLDTLAADEVVPMFFRMGESADGYHDILVYHPERLSQRCRQQALGLAVQEPLPLAVQQRYARRYWFNYASWNQQARLHE
jgi:hypothetical protein